MATSLPAVTPLDIALIKSLYSPHEYQGELFPVAMILPSLNALNGVVKLSIDFLLSWWG